MGRFDERCPHCEASIENINARFIDHDYATSFKFDCPSCEKPIEVDVHQVPEFELSKAQTPLEYAAFLKQLAETKHLCAGCNYYLIPDDVSLCKACLQKAGV